MSVPIRFRSRRVGAAQEPPRAARKDMTTCSGMYDAILFDWETQCQWTHDQSEQ